jgi:hypothetical protein
VYVKYNNVKTKIPEIALFWLIVTAVHNKVQKTQHAFNNVI